MDVTNRLDLPLPIVNAVKADPYTKGEADFSITELLLPPQIRRLRMMYEGHPDLVPDVADKIYALIGSAVHTIMEEHAPEDHIIEERIYRTIEVDGVEYVISGALDVQDGVIIRDWKCVGTGTVMYGTQPKPEWVEQLNGYQWLVGEPRELEIGAIFRDWSKGEANKTEKGLPRAKKNYPLAPAMVIPLEAWSLERCEDFIHMKVREHVAESVRSCTDSETWDRGRGPVRCESWCDVSELCPQYGGGLF